MTARSIFNFYFNSHLHLPNSGTKHTKYATRSKAKLPGSVRRASPAPCNGQYQREGLALAVIVDPQGGSGQYRRGERIRTTREKEKIHKIKNRREKKIIIKRPKKYSNERTPNPPLELWRFLCRPVFWTPFLPARPIDDPGGDKTRQQDLLGLRRFGSFNWHLILISYFLYFRPRL